MKIKGSVSTRMPIVPDRLRKHIIQTATCPLTPQEYEGAQLALFFLNCYQAENPLSDWAVSNVLYTDRETITLEELGEATLGASVHLSVIRLNALRRQSDPSQLYYVLVVLEELCHSLYHIKNEYEVKRLVYDILKGNPQISLHKLYNEMFDENGKPIYLPEHAEDYAELLSD